MAATASAATAFVLPLQSSTPRLTHSRSAVTCALPDFTLSLSSSVSSLYNAQPRRPSSITCLQVTANAAGAGGEKKSVLIVNTNGGGGDAVIGFGHAVIGFYFANTNGGGGDAVIGFGHAVIGFYFAKELPGAGHDVTVLTVVASTSQWNFLVPVMMSLC